MKVSVEKLPTSEAVLDVELTWDELEKASDKAYRKLVQKIEIQGFRRGKAPRSLVERKVGKEYIYQEGLDDLITETYRDILKENELTPLAQPHLDAPALEIGQPYHFSLTVPILTPVELGDYHSLHFEREEVEVTSEEVEEELEKLRERQAAWEEVERPAQIGDRVTVDLKLTVEEQIISDLKDNPFELTDERHGMFSGMDEQIVGMQAGESKDFTATIPEDYGNEKIAGKEAHYEIILHKIEVKELPELDDAFASSVSTYQSLEDLRKAVSDSILEGKTRKNRDELRQKVVDAVIEQSQISVHPVLVQEEAEDMLHQLSHMLEQQHMSVDQYLMMMRKSRAEYLKDLEPDAEKRVRRQLVLDEVARAEKLRVEPEELEALFRAYSQAGQELPRTESQIQALAFTYIREKAITYLVELAAGPDPDTVPVDVEAEADEIVSEENATAAALEGEAIEAATESAIVESEDSATIITEGTPAEAQ